MKRALTIGIDNYSSSPLGGCVNDARKVEELLRTHYDGSPNFNVRTVLGDFGEPEIVTRSRLRQNIEELFKSPADVAVFFFAGHGFIEKTGGYLVTQDAQQYDEGVSMQDLLTHAQRSPVREVVIILDCCHSGAMGRVPELNNEQALLREGISILTASRDSEYATEVNGGGLFTSLVCDALSGGAADVVGNVTAADLYAYADQALDAWDQRPMFMAHVSRLTPLRHSKPKVRPEVLRRIVTHFPKREFEFQLDPSFEPDNKVRPAYVAKSPKNEGVFDELQKLRSVGLVEPVGEDHMFYAAMRSASCRLTPLGRFYWDCIKTGRV